MGLMQSADWGWSAPSTLGLLAGGTVMLAAFVAIEARKTAPLIEIGLFRNATFTSANLAIFAGQFGQIAVVVFVAVYLQHVLAMSPLHAGLALLPGVLMLPFSPIVAGRLSDRFGARRPVLFGLLLFGLSLLGIAFAVGVKSYALLVGPLILWGCTMTLLYVPTRRAVMGVVPAAEHGAAGGINLTAQLTGGTVGMASGGTLLATTGDYRIVFVAAALLVLAVLAIAWFTLERAPTAGSNRHRPDLTRG